MLQEFFLQHYVGHHPNVDFSDRISYHDVRWRPSTPQKCAFRSAWNSLEAFKTWWYTTLYQLPATANSNQMFTSNLSLLLQALSFCLNSKFQWNSIQPRVLPLFFVPGISVDTQIEGWGEPTSETKFKKTPGHKCSERGDDLKPWIIPTRWWQLKCFLFWPRKLGSHDPFWLAHLFQMGWFNHLVSQLFLKPFISETWFVFWLLKSSNIHHITCPNSPRKSHFRTSHQLCLLSTTVGWFVRPQRSPIFFRDMLAVFRYE